MSFSLVRHPDRAAELSELRQLSYGSASISGPEDPHAVGDPRDRRAVVIIAEEANKIVGSVRVIPPGPGPILHPECRLEGDVLNLPRHETLVEGGWGCIHPDFRGHGLFWQLSAHMLLIGRDFGAATLVAGSSPALWPFWRRCGFRKTGVSYTGLISGTRYFVLLNDLDSSISGHGVDAEFAKRLSALAADLDRPKP